MQAIYKLISLILALLILSFVFSNSGSVALRLWPFPFEVEVPTFMLGLGGLLIGFFFGVFFMAVRNLFLSFAKKSTHIKDSEFR